MARANLKKRMPQGITINKLPAPRPCAYNQLRSVAQKLGNEQESEVEK
jgi:hypothetical protein